jgi:hypothetical protein
MWHAATFSGKLAETEFFLNSISPIPYYPIHTFTAVKASDIDFIVFVFVNILSLTIHTTLLFPQFLEERVSHE